MMMEKMLKMIPFDFDESSLITLSAAYLLHAFCILY